MVWQNGYRDGEICWAELVTPDVDVATDFYGRLFGWEFTVEGDGYVVAARARSPVAGLTVPRPGEQTGWRTCVASADVDALAEQVATHGGQVVSAPADRFGPARQVVVADPTGATFAGWAGPGFGTDGQPGTVNWAGLTTNDADRVDDFYTALFRYEPMPTRYDHSGSVWSLGGQAVCSRMAMGPDYPAGVPSHWMLYFGVADADEAAGTVPGMGGKVQFGPFDSPLGRAVVFDDPQGVVCSVVESPIKLVLTGAAS